MSSQPSLLDPSGANLPGPLFTPRPGWGGKLSKWLGENLYIFIFRLVVLAALFLIVFSLVSAWRTNPPLPSPTPEPLSQNWTFHTAASSGEGMTDLAAWAVDAYLTRHDPQVSLSAVEHIYTVDRLSRLVGWHRLEVGEEIEFDADDIASIIERAYSLPAQRDAWARFLR